MRKQEKSGAHGRGTGGDPARRRTGLRALLLGGAAGLVNGFFGTGGGMILLCFALRHDVRAGRDPRDTFAETLVVTLCLSAVSAVVYALRGALPGGFPFRYCLPALIGGMLGALCLDRCPTGLLRRLFAVLATVAGALMLFR